MAKETAPAPTSLKSLSTIEEGIKRSESYFVDPNLIQFEEGFNLRSPGKDTNEHIERIFKAMKAGATVPAIDVQIVEGKIIARDGHCRTTAAIKLRAENPEFQIQVRQLRGNDADAVLHMLGTGSGQKPLTPLEQGKGFLRLVNMGLKNKEIADRIGVSRVTIDNGLTLAEAPIEVQKMIMAGEVSSTTAREAIKQGTEGTKALVEMVKAKRAETTAASSEEASTDGDKKKKEEKTKRNMVTAKNLKDTAAETKPKKKDVEPSEDQKQKAWAAGESVTQPEADPNSIAITVSRDVAKEVADYLRANAPEDATALLKFASDLEMNLM